MKIRSLSYMDFLVAVGLMAIAALFHFWFGYSLTHLPADYANETRYAADIRYRPSPTAEWQEYPLTARRVDQTLSVAGEVSIIQGEIHWTTEDGTPTYETLGLYGVDDYTRQNVPEYGDRERTGQFLFPPHLQPVTYTFWDPFYQGPRTATFVREDRFEGLTVYVFDYTATDIDDTAGSEFLPDVPERYRILSNGKGRLWIEPVSGVVVGFEDEGVSDFVDAVTGERVADQYHWTDRYTPETQAAQIQLARSARLRILTLEDYLPIGLLAGGLLWLGIGLWRRRS